MAYRSEFRYKGGTRRVREKKRNQKALRVVGMCLLWLFIGMFVTHLIFSVVAKVRKQSAELDALGVPPILTIQDMANAEERSVLYYDGSLSDSYELDSFIAFAKGKGISGVLVDLKPESGILAYKSTVATAKKILALNETALDLGSISVKFDNADIELIARLSVYADDAYAVAYPKRAAHKTVIEKVPVENPDDPEAGPTEEVRETEELWLDSDKHAWVSPCDVDMRDYVVELIEEIASAGVNTVMLDNVFFPSAAQTDGAVAFPGEEESGVPRAGTVRTNVSVFRAAAAAKGAKLYVAADARYVCGEQDSEAGVTFNLFELDADAICPVCMPSELEKAGVTAIADFEFESAETAELPKLFEALATRMKLIQGAIDTPPALVPIVQGYTDTSIPAAKRREWTAADLSAELDALKAQNIRGKIIYGTLEDYGELLVTPEAPTESESTEVQQ